MEFDAKYKNRGLAVIGVSMDEDGWKTVKPFLALQKDPETGGHTAMKYPVVIGSASLAKQYNLTSMPMTLLIDRDGRIAVSHSGMVDKDEWEGKIQSLLN
jgi:peroxiredoxin